MLRTIGMTALLTALLTTNAVADPGKGKGHKSQAKSWKEYDKAWDKIRKEEAKYWDKVRKTDQRYDRYYVRPSDDDFYDEYRYLDEDRRYFEYYPRRSYNESRYERYAPEPSPYYDDRYYVPGRGAEKGARIGAKIGAWLGGAEGAAIGADLGREIGEDADRD